MDEKNGKHSDEGQSPVRKWRTENGISQQALANRLGVTQGMVSQYELLGLPNKTSTLVNIANETGIPFDDLLAHVVTE